MAMPTLMDIAVMNGNDAVVGLVEEVIVAVPELAVIPMRTIRGQQYRSLVRTSLPGVAFRSANEGMTETKSTYEHRLVETFILNPTWKCDKMVADVYEDGAEAYIALEASGMMNAANLAICSQMYYGTSNDSKGFPGLASFVDSGMVIDATGSGNASSSVWALKFGPQAVSMVVGGEGKFDMSDVRIGDAYDSNNKRYTAYIQELMSWMGLQVLNKYAVGRIKNLTTAAGKGLTDSLLSQLLEVFPTRPDAFIMTRRSRGQLQRSRTATNATGAEAPLPTSYEGIPFIISESLLNTETAA